MFYHTVFDIFQISCTVLVTKEINMTTNELKAKFELEKKQLLERQKNEKAKFSKIASKQLNRKKIILGSVMLKRIQANAKNVMDFTRSQLSSLSEKDKALFPELFAPVVQTSESTNN